MRFRSLWRIPGPYLRWGGLCLVLAAAGVGVHVLQPAEPRWVMVGGAMTAFDVGGGYFATHAAAGAATGPLQLWDAATGNEAGRFLEGERPFQSHASSDDGRFFVALVKSDKPDVWHIRGVDLQERREWRADARVGPYTSATFSPRCDFVALRMPAVDDSGEFYTIVETSSGRVVAHLPGAADQLSFAGNGGCVVAGYSDEENLGETRVLSTGTGKTTVIAGSRCLAVSPDAHWLIGDRGDDGVWLWDIGRARWHAPLGEPRAKPAPGRLNIDGWADPSLYYALAFRGAGSLKATRYYGKSSTRYRTLRLWTAYSGDSVSVIFPYSGDGRLFSPDSRYVLCTEIRDSDQPHSTLYDLETARPLWKRTRQKNPRTPMFTADARRIVVATDAAQVEILNVETGETERTIDSGLPSPSWRMSRDGTTLIAVATPQEEEPHWLWAKLEAWLNPRRDGVPMVIRAYAVETGLALAELRTEEADSYWLTGDDRGLVTVDSENNEQGIVATTIRGWDMPAHKPLRWTLSVPLALGVLLLTVQYAWRRLRRPKVVARG